MELLNKKVIICPRTGRLGNQLLNIILATSLCIQYDINLIKLFKDELKIPVILNGGMGEPIHAVEAIQNGADAIAAAYIFHFSQYTPKDIRNKLAEYNISVRII